jgi:hypothetical protein
MSATETETGRHFPGMPPELPGEASDAYTDRLTGADQSGRIPYDHPRNRQCSIGYHGECSDPAGKTCKCPCHTAEGRLEMRVDELEELVVATYGLITGRARRQSAEHLGAEMADDVTEIVARKPKLAEWYLRPGKEAR